MLQVKVLCSILENTYCTRVLCNELLISNIRVLDSSTYTYQINLGATFLEFDLLSKIYNQYAVFANRIRKIEQNNLVYKYSIIYYTCKV